MSHPLLARLADPRADERARACRDALGDPSAVVLVDALAEALGDPDRSVARAASDALAALGRRHDVSDALRRALRSPEPGRAWGAARALSRLEPPSPRLLPALVSALGLPYGDDRWAAAHLLVHLGRVHDEVLPLLLGLAQSGGPPTCRAMAAHCLRELAPDLPESAEAILSVSRDADTRVRRAGLSALAGLLDPPENVLAELRERSQSDPDPASRKLAAAALERLGGDGKM